MGAIIRALISWCLSGEELKWHRLPMTVERQTGSLTSQEVKAQL